ncbi:MAG: CRISPR-associated endonuclease Cas1 [Candidatus Limnocylindrales bacterium]
MSVDHGRLVVRDGIGRAPRTRTYGRATHGLKRVVLIGHSGFVTLEATRWLADVGIGFVQIDGDGRILSASAGMGLDDPRLRRAQAIAWNTPTGVGCARTLLRAKVEGQARVAKQLGAGPEILEQIERCYEAFDDATTPDELMIPEAGAAVAYWEAWRDVPVRFATVDHERLPGHWRTFGQRRSPVSRASRLSANPANAVLNYLYAILEAEARLACLTMGLDPGLGVLHADLKARDSLALDVMEAVRPDVDGWTLDLLARHVFRARDFFETRQGVCRVLPPLAHELASTGPVWARSLAPVVERVARDLTGGPESRVERLPTPLTGSHRAAGPKVVRARSSFPVSAALVRPSCQGCGEVIEARGRQYCDPCLVVRKREQADTFVLAGRQRLANLRADGGKPARNSASTVRQVAKMAGHRRSRAAWRGPLPDPDTFAAELLPGLTSLPTRALVDATGLTRGYCSRIQRGECVPHPMHWEALRSAAAAPREPAVQ